MRAQNLLDQRMSALQKTERQIEAVKQANEDSGDNRYRTVLNALYVKERRQAAAVKDAQLRVDLELQIGFEID